MLFKQIFIVEYNYYVYVSIVCSFKRQYINCDFLFIQKHEVNCNKTSLETSFSLKFIQFS